MKRLKILLPLFLLILSALPLAAEDNSFYWGIFEEGLHADASRLKNLETIYPKKPGIVMWYLDWKLAFPAEACQKLNAMGILPHLVWEPWFFGDNTAIKHADILAGKWDKYITQFAKDAAAYGKPVMIRWGHEMNGNWYPWSGAQNGNSAESYVKTYRYVYDLMKKNGATNLIWVWCPNNDSVPNEPWNEVTKYYPGDNYVDWVGIDGYNFGTSQSWSHWVSVDEAFSTIYGKLQEKFPGKPVIIAEFGCSSSGGDKAIWIKDFFAKIRTRYPNVKAWVWFNINKETDWRFSSDETSRKAFMAELATPSVLTAGPALATLHKGYKAAKNPVQDLASKRSVNAVYSASPLTLSSPEWAKAKPAALDFPARAKAEGLPVSGPGDLDGSIRLAWNEEYLMIFMDWKDDVPFLNKKYRADVWNGDAFEITLGLNQKADPRRTSFGQGDFQLGVSHSATAPQVWCWTTNKLYMKEAKVEFVKESAGGKMIVLLPWNVLGYAYTPKKGDKIGFDYALDDADESADREMQAVWEGNRSFYKDPSQWGFMILE
jgi:hypothetical protein